MHTGMLWFDNNDQRDMESKLQRAVEYYEKKYGKRPGVCVVHPLTLAGQQKDLLGLNIRTSNTVLPHHFWLGEDRPGKKKKRPAA